MTVSVRIGFVPSYRFGWTPWTEKMRQESLAAFARLRGLEVVVPRPAPDGQSLDAGHGYVPHGAVQNLDQAEVVA